MNNQKTTHFKKRRKLIKIKNQPEFNEETQAEFQHYKKMETTPLNINKHSTFVQENNEIMPRNS